MSYQVEQQNYLQAVDKSTSEDYDSDNSSCATNSENYSQVQNNNEQTTKLTSFNYLAPIDDAATNGTASQDTNRIQFNYFNSAPAYVAQYPKTNEFDYQMNYYLNGLSYNETMNNPAASSYSDMLARTYSMVNFYSGFNQQPSVNDENYTVQAGPNSVSEEQENNSADKSNNNDSSNEDERPDSVVKKPPTKSNNRSKKPTKPNSKQQNQQQITPATSAANMPSYLAQAPDSETLALAAAQAVEASRNRSKKRIRIKFDQRQLDILEAAFERTHYPDVNVVDRLSTLLNLTTERISVWFQNRRARFKRTYKPGAKSESAAVPKQEDFDGEESSLNSSNSNLSNKNAPTKHDQFNMGNFTNDQQVSVNNGADSNSSSSGAKNYDDDDTNATGESTETKSEKSAESSEENSASNKASVFSPFMVPFSNQPNNLYNPANAFQMYQSNIAQAPSYFVPNYSQAGSQLKLPCAQEGTYNQPASAISPQSTSSIAPSSTSPSASDDQSTSSKSPSPAKKQADSTEENNQQSDKASDEEYENVDNKPDNGSYQSNMAANLYKQNHANIFQPYIDCTVPSSYSAYNFAQAQVAMPNLQYFAPSLNQVHQSYNYFYP